jgi:hypothetical protein
MRYSLQIGAPTALKRIGQKESSHRHFHVCGKLVQRYLNKPAASG